MTNASTSVEEDFGRVVGNDRKAQLGIGRDARRIARLPWESKDFNYFAESCLANALRGGVQIRAHLRIEPRRVGPEARPQAPIMALFFVARRAIP